jgi:hypothetical protein
MIEKQEFYHGAALYRLIEDVRTVSLRADGIGYVVNEAVFTLIKYATKTSSPWRFTVSADEARTLSRRSKAGQMVFIALVCGGDGICATTWEIASEVLGATPGWLSCRRRFHEQYALAGTEGEVQGKVPDKAWPSILFGADH